MKIKLSLVIMGCLVMLAASSWAQPGKGQGGRGGGMHYGTMWDASSVTTVSGEVTAVEKYTPGRGGSSYGLRLTMKTDKETLPSHPGACLVYRTATLCGRSQGPGGN